MAVVIVLAVLLVVLLVVGDQIVQRKAVMRGDKVNARPRTAPALIVKVAGTKQACGKVGGNVVAFPVFAHRIAVFIVPLRPARREAADLITAGADIPWFADQLHFRKHRVLRYRVEEAAALVEAFRLAAKNGAEIETETVDMHRLRPVAQRIHYHLQYTRMRGIHSVAGAGIVDVITMLVRQSAVIGEVIDALERQRRAEFIAFRRMVIDHVEDDLDAGVVERAHHIAEALNAFRAVVARRGAKKPSEL